METKEKIKVYVDIVKGRTKCICLREDKRCTKDCPEDIVERDKYSGWKNTFQRDKYGKSRD